MVLIIRSKGRRSPHRIRVIDRESFIKLSRFFPTGSKAFPNDSRERNIAKRGIINFSNNVSVFSTAWKNTFSRSLLAQYTSQHLKLLDLIDIAYRFSCSILDTHHYNSTSLYTRAYNTDDVISKQTDIFITRITPTVFIVTVQIIYYKWNTQQSFAEVCRVTRAIQI